MIFTIDLFSKVSVSLVAVSCLDKLCKTLSLTLGGHTVRHTLWLKYNYKWNVYK